MYESSLCRITATGDKQSCGLSNHRFFSVVVQSTSDAASAVDRIIPRVHAFLNCSFIIMLVKPRACHILIIARVIGINYISGSEEAVIYILLREGRKEKY